MLSYKEICALIFTQFQKFKIEKSYILEKILLFKMTKFEDLNEIQVIILLAMYYLNKSSKPTYTSSIIQYIQENYLISISDNDFNNCVINNRSKSIETKGLSKSKIEGQKKHSPIFPNIEATFFPKYRHKPKHMEDLKEALLKFKKKLNHLPINTKDEKKVSKANINMIYSFILLYRKSTEKKEIKQLINS